MQTNTIPEERYVALNDVPRVLLLTGPPGSGKTTIAKLISEIHNDWKRISEDDIWPSLFGKDRGRPDTNCGFKKMKVVHEVIFDQIKSNRLAGKNVVVDFLVVSDPPISLLDYQIFLGEQQIPYEVRVLNPPFSLTVERDKDRSCWTLGEAKLKEPYQAIQKLQLPGCSFVRNTEVDALETYLRHFRNWDFIRPNTGYSQV